MPVRSGGAAPTTNGHCSIHVPGAYEAVLRECAAEKALDEALARGRAPGLLDTDDPAAVEAARCQLAERVAELIEQRRGQPLHVQSYMLPPGLVSPFEQWPHQGCQRSVTVDPSDVITLRPRPVRVR